MGLIQLAVFSVVALAIAMFVLRPMLAARREQEALVEAEGEAPALVTELAGPSEIEMTLAAAEDVIDAESVEADRLALLQGAVQDRPAEAAALLAAWLDMDEERREPA